MTKKPNMTLEKRIKALVATNSMKSRESFFKRLAYKIYAYRDSDGESLGVVKDFTQFENKNVIVKGCGKYPIPESVFVDFSVKLQSFAKNIMFGEACSAVPLFKKPKK